MAETGKSVLRIRILSALVLVSSLFGFLEWGGGNAEFLFAAEMEVITKLATNPRQALHPFTVLPMLGQLLLLVSLFLKVPRPWIIYFAVVFLGLLLCMVLFIGVLSRNVSMFVSALPFVFSAFLLVREVIVYKRATRPLS